MTDNIYQTPSADLTQIDETEASKVNGSLETAMLGEYYIEIGEIRREAWRLTKGNKGAVWLAIMILSAILFGAHYVLLKWIQCQD